MKKTFYVLGFVSVVVWINVFLTTSGCSPKHVAGNGDSGITNKYANLPLDTVQTQKEADLFSWQTFIAMNWPANTATCGPDTSNGVTILNGTGPTVWESYLSTDQVF